MTFSLLIKPSSADCNLRCNYCFYLGKGPSLYPETTRHRMSEKVLEATIASYLATHQPQYSFGWQGGEPTLMGHEFFRQVTRLQRKHGPPGSVVANGLQTNGVRMTGDLAAHLARYKFLVGVSLDGPPELHNYYRRTQGNVGSHDLVLRGIDLLRRFGVEFNILTLVNSYNVQHAVEIYRYLRDNRFYFHQYIPCVEFDRHGRPLPYSVAPEEWGSFLCDIFDEWIRADPLRVSIRLFDSILGYLVDGVHNVCHMRDSCCQYFLVEYNGDVYPCDFFAEEGKKLGNIMTSSWEAIANSQSYMSFGAMKAQVHRACKSCEHAILCAGDCLKHRFHRTQDPRQLSYLCNGWKRFYRHSLPGFRDLAQGILRQRATASSPTAPAPREVSPPASVSGLNKLGRNDPCSCQSGRKYKHCCGK